MTISPIKWATLTLDQQKAFSNGCGGKGSIIPVPDWIFTASCDHHDFNYWLGGTEEDRKKADWQFYQAMLVDAKTHPWYKQYWYRTMAWVYYKAVRLGASSYFYYSDVDRTLEDVYAEIRNNNL